MKILSIELNPFAGLSNYNMTFTEGMNVKCGPNEAGKSTIVKALIMTLFVPTNLTPAALKEAISKYLPNPNGDTINTKLRFSVNGSNYTIEKSWGGTQYSKLIMPDGFTITDPKTVQSKLLELVNLNEATYRSILICSQSELKSSIDNLQNNHFVKAALSDTLRKSIMEQDGISADSFKAVLSNKVDLYFNNWDRINSRPRDNKDINNKHQKKVGHILKSYYQKRESEESLKFANQFEKDLDEIIKEIQTLTTDVQSLIDFLSINKQPYDDSKMRNVYWAEKFKIDTLFDKLKKDLSEWPLSENELERATKEVPRLSEELKDLENELELANRFQRAELVKQKYSSAKNAKTEIDLSLAALKNLIQIDQTDLNIAHEKQQLIYDCHVKIKAQQMKLAIRAKKPVNMDLKHGDIAETYPLNLNDEREFNLSGKFHIETDELVITIESLQEDISALEEIIHNAHSNLNDLFLKYKADSVETLIFLQREYESKKNQIENQKGSFKILLNGEDFELLEQEYNKTLNMPSSRPMDVISKKIIDTRALLKDATTALETSNARLNVLNREHTSKEALEQRMMNGLLKRGEVDKKIESLKAIPQEYRSDNDFISDFENKFSQKDTLKERLNNLRIERERLELLKPTKSVKELKEDLEIYDKEFSKKCEEGESYLKILKTLDDILSTINEETYDPLQERVNFYIAQLSRSKYSRVNLEGVEPTSLQNHTKILDLELLSKGTIDIVALALRLGTADFYLKSLDGFIIMDDPLVDLDLNRQETAAKVISEFALNKQVIVFTCHDQNAKLLKEDYDVMEAIEEISTF